MYFNASDGTNGWELWKSDGTEGGTVMVNDINPGVDSFDPSGFFNFNNTLYFAANDGTNGWELWKSDGTDGGTVMVKDINLPGDSFPLKFFNFNNTLYFTADDGVNGKELWKSDGTEGGTVMVEDINPGAGGYIADYEYFVYSTMNNIQYFFANDGTHGYELWKLNVLPSVTSVTPSSGTDQGGTSITITGEDFSAGATVTIGGVSATNVTVVNSTTITATTPSGTEGSQNIVVTNSDNNSSTLTNGFTYTASTPVITSSRRRGACTNCSSRNQPYFNQNNIVTKSEAVKTSSFTKYLRYGQVDEDVKKLQILLNKDPDTRIADYGPGSPGNETNFFGLMTKKSVIKFQEKYTKDILQPWSLDKGTGFVSKTTIDKLNDLIGQRGW